MWNPEIYRDTDYGLDREERFEPLDDLEEEYRPAPGEPWVQTVLGPIPPEEAGLALVHEHLQWAPAGQTWADVDHRLDDPSAALADLEAFFTVSGRTIVSATPSAAGRDARSLRWLAQHAPVHIVAVTGFAAHRYLIDRHGDTAADALARDIDRDLDEGMDGSGARPGAIVTTTSQPGGTALEREAIAAAAAAHARTGLPVIAHTENGNGVAAHLRALADDGVPTDRVIAARADLVQEDDLRDIASAGAFVAIDQVGNPHVGSDADRAARVVRLFADGYGDQVLLSHGFARRSMLLGYGGGPGLPYIVEQFAVMLLEEGLAAMDVRRILVENAARAISVVPPLRAEAL